MDAATRARIQSDYPAFAWLLDNPDVGPLLEQATNEGWPESKFIAALWATPYYRSRTEANRQMETLRQLDPTQFQHILSQKYASVQDVAGRLGITFTEPELGYIATGITYGGDTMDAEQQKIFLLNWMRANPNRISNTGSAYANAARADQIARQEFFFAPRAEDTMKYGIEASLGYNNEDAYRESLGEWFASVTPHLATRLKAGETYAQIVNPYRDIVAKELELGGLESVDMVGTNQWKWLMGMPDPTSGEVRLPTQQEVIQAARTDPRWKGTMGGTSLATSLVDGITKAMGVRA
jgi:hypothetical protein